MTGQAGQVRTDQIKTGQVSRRIVMIGQLRTGQDGICQPWTGQFRKGQVWTSQVKGQVKSSQDRSSLVKIGQIKGELLTH